MCKRAAAADAESLDDLRLLLIEAGQLEQGVADAVASRAAASCEILALVAGMTDRAAESFLDRWQTRPDGRRTFARFVDALDVQLPDVMLTIKVPEGFAFYGLFPEQYGAAALAWAVDHSRFRPGPCLVIGMRSIGTTLSSIVATTLARDGWNVLRSTVRASGPPFQRHVEPGSLPSGKFKCALVVDEGPGLSGSTMAAAAEALAAAGISNVAFLPAHGGGPGPSASSEVRIWWTRTPRYIRALDELKWSGLSLAEVLGARAGEFSRVPPGWNSIQDLSAGKWREFAFQRESDWPAATTPFEQMKLRHTESSGRSVVWKFAGLGCRPDGESACEWAFLESARRAHAGFCPAPLGFFHGFVAVPWIAGERLTRSDASDASLLNFIGQYILQAATPAAPGWEKRHSVSRLAGMLYSNTRESLGESHAKRTRAYVAQAQKRHDSLMYGDGRLAPHEWVRGKDGRLWKTDCQGHDRDHTIVGPQSLLWDVAGAMIEWNIGSNAARPLLAPFRDAGIEIEPGALRFYRMAYAAFRLGVCSTCALQADGSEKTRLKDASAFYLNWLSGLLESSRVIDQRHP